VRGLEPKIELDDDLMAKARVPIERMLSVGRGDEG
jgi:quinolinate synthase